MQPTLFISHGAPNTLLKESQIKNNLRMIRETLSNPQYIVVISSHWVTKGIEIINPLTQELMYDFYGFEKELYEFTYPMKSNELYTQRVISQFVNFDVKINYDRKSFDHGVWTVLSMIYEKLEVPVIQLSLPIDFTAKELFDFGKTLQTLREEALIICSGSITHNLSDMQFPIDATVKAYAKSFDDEIKTALLKGDVSLIKEYEKIPFFKHNHPSSEHFLPLLIALGTSKEYKAEIINQVMTYSNISMSSYIFKG